MEERERFIREWQRNQNAFAELCRRYEISRQTGYKWMKRVEELGDLGLADQSRAPHHSPQAMSEQVVAQVMGLRQQHPRWGPRKLRAYLEQHDTAQRWPAVSSIGELLHREGLSIARKKWQRTPAYSEPLAHAVAANQVWCADFKGWFLCGDGKRCDPLTVTDAFSRCLLRCQHVSKTDGEHVRGIFEAAFREFGMPVAIRTDNGPPFATAGPAGLSRLGLWWVRLGIRHERIDRGCPQQNGRHERMHLTLKQETASPPAANLRKQQEAFQRFQKEYNEQRPHEALSYRTPGSLYVRSPRLYPARLPEPAFPVGAITRMIDKRGLMRWNNERVFLSRALSGEPVGLLQTDEEFYELYYGPVLLGWYDAAANLFVAERAEDQRRRRKEHIEAAKARRD